MSRTQSAECSKCRGVRTEHAACNISRASLGTEWQPKSGSPRQARQGHQVKQTKRTQKDEVLCTNGRASGIAAAHQSLIEPLNGSTHETQP